MICQNCHKEIPEISKFCRFCGIEQETREPSHTEETDNASTKEHRVYAGFLIRLGAYIIDLLGIVAGSMIFGYVIGYIGGLVFGEIFIDWIDYIPDTIYAYFGYAIYSTIFLTIWSTTAGKYLYGLTVTNEQGEPLDFNTALKRSLLQPFSTLLFGIGYWNMNKEERKQAWHDKKVNTYVIRNEAHGLALAYIVTFIVAVLWIILVYYFSE